MTWLETTIAKQREGLIHRLAPLLERLAAECASAWGDGYALDQALLRGMAGLPLARLLYATDTAGVQISANIGRDTVQPEPRGQNLSARPYLNAVPYRGMLLSEVYISRVDGRACITAVQAVHQGGAMLGYLAADFRLSELPLDTLPAETACGWRQIKGDPAIRNGVFAQTRAVSAMDTHIEDVMGIMDELIGERGVFHAKLHFSSSRATLWLTTDPCRYRLHVLEEIIDPAVCLAYPVQPYPQDAVVARADVRPVLARLRLLREADEVIYLRSGSLNVMNGMVGLTFSCDGTHYMPASEFLEKDTAFWFGNAV